MKLTILFCLVLVVAGAYWIAQRDKCERFVASRYLPANHLLEATDWLDRGDVGIACEPSEAANLVGRYVDLDRQKGESLSLAETRAVPRIATPAETSAYWIAVPDGTPLRWMEPGSTFDLCSSSACELPLQRAKAIRCAATGSKPTCEVAIIVQDSDTGKLQAVVAKPYRFLFRERKP